MPDKPVIDYQSSRTVPLSAEERRAFVLLLPAVIGRPAGLVCWLWLFVVTVH